MKQELEQFITDVVRDVYGVELEAELTRPDAQFGDFATNVAMRLTKAIGKNPRQIAEELAEKLQSEIIERVEIAGPGFLNITLSDDYLLRNSGVSNGQPMTGQKVLVEYSDPNPFKPLHAGHLYTTLVGDAIARLVENAGAETVRLNFGGDVGLHTGKSMWAILRHLGGEHPDKLANIEESNRADWLGQRYVEGNNAYEDDEAARSEIIAVNKRTYAIHDENDHLSDFAQIYWICREWSYEYFATLYKQLQVVPFDRFIPESEVAPIGLKAVQEQVDAGIFQKSDGAVVFEGDESAGLHTRVFITKEGIPTYETKDVGLSLTKWQDYQFDESIIITANEQSQYMQVVLAAIEQFEPEAANRTKHLTHGIVKLQGGVKMSSRKGNIVSAIDILESARAAAKAVNTNATEETMLAAVKYALLKVRIGGDIVYDPVESVALEGNSGPYLQYAHARARSILSKATTVEAQMDTNDIAADERLMIRKITEYNEVVERATNELMPHHICTYLYELAQEFNRFYEKNRVIGDDREDLRLKLVQTYADTLKNGLNLLGIHALDQM